MATMTPTSPQPLQAPPNSGQQAPQQGQGMQAQAPPIMQLLGDWHRVSQEIAEAYPPTAPAMSKIAAATREALTVLAQEHFGKQQGHGQGLPVETQSAPQTAQPTNYPPSGF